MIRQLAASMQETWRWTSQRKEITEMICECLQTVDVIKLALTDHDLAY